MNKELIKQALSNLQNLTVRNDIPLKKDKFYNCWGFYSKLSWMEYSVILGKSRNHGKTTSA